MINLRNLAEQQKNQRALKIKNRILKQTHDVKLAESLSPTTKKLDKINESTQQLGIVFKESNDVKDKIKSLPNSSNISNSMREMLGSLMQSHNCLKLTQDEFGQATILGVPIYISGDDRIKINDNIYDLTPQISKALSSTSYYGKKIEI